MIHCSWRSYDIVLTGMALLILLRSGFAMALPETVTPLMVTSLADPGTGGCTPVECTLREALDMAQRGDTIKFDPALFASGQGTITLVVGELVIARDVTITGPGSHLLRISGDLVTRILRVNAGVVARIEQITLREGRATYGGGLFNDGTLALVRSIVHDNTAIGGGGGMYNRGTLTLVQSTVRGNTSVLGWGGGLFSGGTLTLVQSTVSDNTTRGSGGGLANVGTLRLQKSTVHGNTARGSGGGLANVGMLTLVQSTVSGNTARDNGGGLANQGTMLLKQSTVSGNSTRGSGGGLFNSKPVGIHVYKLTLLHSTVSDNAAGVGGGGLFNDSGVLTLRTTIVAGNTASTGGPDCGNSSGTIRSHGHNLTGLATGCPNDASRGDVTIDPALVLTQLLGPLQDNGGLTFTHALLPGSLAIDAGDPAICRQTDQRGVPRPQGAGCDIGAFELEE